jgi:hypothetical protein
MPEAPEKVPEPAERTTAKPVKPGHTLQQLRMKEAQYVQTDLEADRQVANRLAELIIGGSLTSFEIAGTVG